MPTNQYPDDLFNHVAHFFDDKSHTARGLDVRQAAADAFDSLKKDFPNYAELLTWTLTLPKHTSFAETGKKLGVSRSTAHRRFDKAWRKFMNRTFHFVRAQGEELYELNRLDQHKS